MKENKIFNDTKTAFKLKSDWEMCKALFLFKCIKNPWLNKISTSLANWLVKHNEPITSYLIKKLVFQHFCGGQNKIECSYIINKLCSNGVQSVLDYAIESQSKEEDFDRIFFEMLSNIDFSKDNNCVPFIVFKPTGIGNTNIYEKISKKCQLNYEEEFAWTRIKNRFDSICKKAFENNVCVLIDAEESWIQNAVDDLSEEMMKEYNKEKCIVFNTLQMYRWDRLEYLKKSHEDALSGKYYIGYKLVRGAYMEKERDRAKLMGYKDPIHKNKKYTDYDYNEALNYAIKNINIISIFAGTHNEESCDLLRKLSEEKHINKKSYHIWFGQLYGMSDHITFELGKIGYNATKYIPYGPLKETIPYLIRRAQENVSITGQTNRELKLIENEIKRRIYIRFS